MARLPELSKEDLEKIERLKGGKAEPVKPITPEQYFLGKLLYLCGYEAVRAYYSGELSHESAIELIDATDVVWHEYEYKRALGMFYATKDGKSFNKGEPFTHHIKVES